jgi:SAM-dependent methyltransferase
MADGYAYEHGWAEERVRLRGLELALDPGTRDHFMRLGAGPGKRCLEVGAGGGSIALWLADLVGTDGRVVATDLETDFLEAEAAGRPQLEVLHHDITKEDLPGGFDFVHARYVVEWLPEKRVALQRMFAALRPGGILLDEEPDFATMYAQAEPPALRRVVEASMRYLETTCPVNVQYGHRLLDELAAVGATGVDAVGRSAVVRGASPPAGHFLRYTIEKLRAGTIAAGGVTDAEYDEAIAALQDPGVTVVMPMTIAAWGRRP